MNELADVPASMFALINFPSWEIVIKSTIVIALAALACRLLHRQSAALRHRVWACGLAASLVVPMVCLLLPQFRLPLLPSTMDASRLVTTRDSRPPSPRSTAASSLPGSAGGITTKSVAPRPELDAKSSTAISAGATSDRPEVRGIPVGVRQKSWARASVRPVLAARNDDQFDSVVDFARKAVDLAEATAENR